MKSLLLAACFATGLAAQPDIYMSIAGQVDDLVGIAVETGSLDCGPATVLQTAARYRRLARHYQQLDDALVKLDQTLLELRMNPPIAPMDTRMRQLRRELTARLRQAHGRSDAPETARLLRLIHLADMEIAEAGNRLDQDARDPRLPAMLSALRQLEARVRQNQRVAATAADVLEHWKRKGK